MNKPNFFIVGAPKCGTTALASYLSDRPDVFMTNPKEPLFFLDGKDPVRKIKDERHYRALFRKAGGHKCVGEASVWYLYSKTAMTSIHDRYPRAKIIIMTREPAGFVASLHSQQMFSGMEHEENLQKAWNREKIRIGCLDLDSIDSIEEVVNWRLLYPELLNHQRYVARCKELFGHDQVQVLDLSELKQNVRNVYERVLCFLGLPSDGRSDFEVVNANKVHKSKYLRAILHWISLQQWLLDSARTLKNRFGIATFGVYEWLDKKNVRVVSRPPITEELAQEIKSFAQSKSR